MYNLKIKMIEEKVYITIVTYNILLLETIECLESVFNQIILIFKLF